MEENFIRKFLDLNKDSQIPVIVVLTQSISKKDAEELKKHIDSLNMGITQVVPVLAEDYEIDEKTVIKAHGLDKLADFIYEVIPEAVKNLVLYNRLHILLLFLHFLIQEVGH